MTQFETEHPRRAKAFQMAGGGMATRAIIRPDRRRRIGQCRPWRRPQRGRHRGRRWIHVRYLRSGGIGAAGAAVLPALAKIPRLITPHPIDPERQAIIDYLGSKGVTKMTAGQKTGNEALKYDESVSKGHIGDEGRLNEDLHKEFTASALNHGGVNATNTLGNTMPLMNQQIGNEFKRLTASTALPFSGQPAE